LNARLSNTEFVVRSGQVNSPAAAASEKLKQAVAFQNQPPGEMEFHLSH